MDERSPGYYAVIPASVRYDDAIPANAKLLYGEISALVGAQGYCHASNQYFAKLYGMAEDTITRLISKLEGAGYIVRELERDAEGQIVRRKLYLNVSTPGEHPVGFLSGTLPDKKSVPSRIKSRIDNNNIYTPLSPPEGGVRPSKDRKRSPQYKSQADVLPERFDGFWDFYRKHIPADRNAGSRQKAIRAWDKLKPSDQLVTQMAGALAAQVKSQAWLSGIGVPHASTWINNHGWEDDWGPVAESKADPVEDSNGEEAAEWVN